MEFLCVDSGKRFLSKNEKADEQPNGRFLLKIVKSFQNCVIELL